MREKIVYHKSITCVELVLMSPRLGTYLQLQCRSKVHLTTHNDSVSVLDVLEIC